MENFRHHIVKFSDLNQWLTHEKLFQPNSTMPILCLKPENDG